jgi:hypothetical protein
MFQTIKDVLPIGSEEKSEIKAEGEVLLLDFWTT